MSTDRPELEQRDGKRGKDQGNPTLFFMMLGLIVFLLLIFLFVHPRGSEAGAPQPQGTSSH